MKFNLPIYHTFHSKKKDKTVLVGMNWYRNAHYFLSNKVKESYENAIYYKDKVISKIIPAKNVHISDDRTSIWKAITADIEKGSK